MRHPILDAVTPGICDAADAIAMPALFAILIRASLIFKKEKLKKIRALCPWGFICSFCSIPTKNNVFLKKIRKIVNPILSDNYYLRSYLLTFTDFLTVLKE